MHTTPLMRDALAAIERGWHVIPLVPGGKAPAINQWEARATRDVDLVRQCWMLDDFNIGIATGPSGLAVIDLDVPKPGKPVPAKWAELGCTCGMDVFLLICADAGQQPPLDTYTVTTPTGSLHLYFTAPDDVQLRGTNGEEGRGLGWGIDTRAHGGQVVAAGSVRGGRRYEVTVDRDPAPLPRWLVERLRPAPPPAVPHEPVATRRSNRSRYLDAALRAEIRRVDNAAAGERNQALYIAATALGQLVAGGALTEQEVTDHLLTAARDHVAAGAYRWNQARQTITSGLKAGAKRPRKVAT